MSSGEYRRVQLVGTPNDKSEQGHVPWCAINPWDGFLYTSTFDNVTFINGYSFDESTSTFVYKKSIELRKTSNGVQGGCFSKNGHLILSSNSTNDIRCYSVLNGVFLGSVAIQKENGILYSQEVEGVTTRENITYNKVFAQIHVILLENEEHSGDDIYFKHYSVPNPEFL